jgi:hypothetical protein
MSTPHKPAAHFEVDDPAAAFSKLENFARRVLAVPKKTIDRKLSKGKAPRKKRDRN